MASIFKRKPGKRVPYTIQYEDHTGKRRTAKGFTDKGLTEELAAKLETAARLRRSGLVDPELEQIQSTKALPITELEAAFKESIADNTPKYVNLVSSRIRATFDAADVKCLADLEPERIRGTLRKFMKKPKFGNKTYNHYLQALRCFCNWCVQTGRLLRDPLVSVTALNANADVRHQRRALTPVEMAQLVRSAEESNLWIQGFGGETRARIYLAAYFTGLRRSELASLTPKSFQLHSSPPTLTVEATVSKHRERDTLPLHPEFAGLVAIWIQGMKPGEKLFPKLAQRKTWLMVRKDLERVGIAYETDEGIADFHAAGRHTYITELLRNGASLPEAKELARHSDIKMTMKYTHIGLNDQAKAVSGLKLLKDAEADSALHGRCISRGSEGHSVATDDIQDPDDDPKKPRKTRENVTRRHSVAARDKMEAAGIEPASRDTSVQASTCVVEGLGLVAVNVYRQDFHSNQPGAFLVNNVPDTVDDDPKLRLTFGRLRRAPAVRVA